MKTEVIILAAGQGKRMQSRLPKVLHTLAGKSLLAHVVHTVSHLPGHPKPKVVYGHEGDQLLKALSHIHVDWVLQEKQAGTGHAVMQALPHIQDEAGVLILCGDVPLISKTTLEQLIQATTQGGLGLLTANLPNPFGYGRIKRNAEGQVIAIVEERDASDTERAIQEINTGVYYVPAACLKKWLPLLKNNNHQGELYLTDIIGFAVKETISIHTVQPGSLYEIRGVNDRMQLAELERDFQREQAKKMMQAGVTLLDPARFDVRGEVSVGKDTIIDINVILEGNTHIGERCLIGPNCVIRDCIIADDVHIKANSVLEGATIAAEVVIGPFARLRPETVLAEKVHVGNFVEVKKSKVGAGTKINHLSYVGDAVIGAAVNIGAGTITCNYDGVNKHQTHIGDEAFIGSCTQLVAPVTVGEGATIGAGSTITEDAPAHQLTLSRAPQKSVAGWVRKSEKR